MNNLARDFISKEERDYKYRIGKTLASSLSGFIAGVFATLLFLIIVAFLLKINIQIGL